MKGRVGGGGGGHHGRGASADLLVCFPSRAHLTLMPKAICSPSRLKEPSKRHPTRPAIRGPASPFFRTKTKNMSSEIDEPTSPKVTCAGQIKVRSKQRIHKQRKRPNWLETLGLKKEMTQFLTGLRGLRFDMGCFGSFHGAVDCTTDEEEGDEDEEEKEVGSSGSSTMLSKWFMVLEENHSLGFKKQEQEVEEKRDRSFELPASVPPPNALLLMRCRSAPVKGWLQGEGEEGGGEGDLIAEKSREEEKEKERLVLMSYAPDFFKVSTDIAKETWVVGGMDPLARCRSWKR